MIELTTEDYDNLIEEKNRCRTLAREFETIKDKETDWVYYSGKVSGINEALKRLTIY